MSWNMRQVCTGWCQVFCSPYAEVFELPLFIKGAMGIPAFFSWLKTKYPNIVAKVVEDGRLATQPNPNFQEFDNFYIDLNGIIHQCVHPDGQSPPESEEEIFMLIFKHIDRLFSIVRPRKLLYIAIDGVAPRAKMNQQRSRRFRASKEAAQKQQKILSLQNSSKDKDILLPPLKSDEEFFDPNSITPGTPFMSRLSTALNYYIHLRMNNDPAWENIVVIFSDASVPGEGEHKIIDFIRRQRESTTYDPRTVHCVSGPDADLIMLGLATHEVNFNIIREDFSTSVLIKCSICRQGDHSFESCQGIKPKEGEAEPSIPVRKEYLFVRLNILRNYLERDFRMLQLPFAFDVERAVDDWIFLCFFVGNDFLPHLLSLDIYEGAINRLLAIYREVSHQTMGWLTKHGNIHLDRLQIVMEELGRSEAEIFRIRRVNDLAYQSEQRKRQKQTISSSSVLQQSAEASSVVDNQPNERVRQKRQHLGEDEEQLPSKKSHLETVESSEREDTVRLWEDCWKERYYKQKFNVDGTDVEFRRQVACAYIEGLCWIFKYYREGCISWDWYYPYHYAPFASDFNNIAQFRPSWSEQTKPFSPLEQQMAILPSASRRTIPAGWHQLMTSPESPIIHFYPTNFEVDNDDTKFVGQGIALLSFVDEKLLIKTLKLHYDLLTDEEKKRNRFGPMRLFVGTKHVLYRALLKPYIANVKRPNDCNKLIRRWISIAPESGYGIAGEVSLDSDTCDADACYPTLFHCSDKYEDIQMNKCVMLAYKNGRKSKEIKRRPDYAVLKQIN